MIESFNVVDMLCAIILFHFIVLYYDIFVPILN